MLPGTRQNDDVYCVVFDNYLKPKKPHKKLQIFACNVQQEKPYKEGTTKDGGNVKCIKTVHDVTKYARKWHLSVKRKRIRKFVVSCPKLSSLPGFLAFLRARNDDGLCKRKSGFEIYCEMASIHGFINFVDAKTWQRVFWCLIVCTALVMSFTILAMSNLQNNESPTIVYTETTTYSAWTIPFPAVVLCNANRISRTRAERVARNFAVGTTLAAEQIMQYFRLALYHTDNVESSQQDLHTLHTLLERNNYTLSQLLQQISPDCEREILRCKWQGKIEGCEKFFRKIATPFGYCCAFNHQGQQLIHNESSELSAAASDEPIHATSCSFMMGLSVLLNANVADYWASSSKTPGYHVFVHDSFDFTDASAERYFVSTRTETAMSVSPRTTYASSYVRGENLYSRRCYFPDERPLGAFPAYTQTNCLTTCRSDLLQDKCKCVPHFIPTMSPAQRCGMQHAECVMAHRAIFNKILKDENATYENANYMDNLICDCFPACNFNQYNSVIDSGILDRRFSFGSKYFFKNINISDHIVLHVFYNDLIAERLRLDVNENWLTFVGTFGGIIGLHMGYSFVSGFEIIFFALVRPACNWLTRQQIRYRIKRRQRRELAAARKTHQEQ